MFSNRREGVEAELLNAVLLCLGHQSLPPTDLGRVDEEMASSGGRSSHIFVDKHLQHIDRLFVKNLNLSKNRS
ncbi:hypothetical protein TNCV_2927121 [Trichonephila clavipes]|nr:hypothetical protein TNCV_2927121 [Trichonephila clavipes]